MIQAAPARRWSDRSTRSRLLVLVGIIGLLLVASVATWLSTRGGQPQTPTRYSTAASLPGAMWTWDGSRYTLVPSRGAGPSSNKADMAYDRMRGVIVLWDHGCANLVMGFQGGCTDQVNRTWTWDGLGWTAQPTTSAPTGAGQGTMLFDTKLGRVVYVNGEGQLWTWTGSDWTSLAADGAPAVRRNLGGSLTTFAAGYDEGRQVLVLVLATGTWSWDSKKWAAMGSGIEAVDARADAHIVYDRGRGQLLYLGSRYTWTWSGDRWQPHDQPAISGGAAGYDPIRATVMLIHEDSSACDRTACRAVTWSWDSAAWSRLADEREAPLFPLTRSGAFPPPMATDEARRVAVVFISAS
jgi:hypothetical protein